MDINYIYYQTQTSIADIEKLFGINKTQIRHLVDKRYGKFMPRREMYWNNSTQTFMPKATLEKDIISRLTDKQSIETIVEDLDVTPYTIRLVGKKVGFFKSPDIDDGPDEGDRFEDVIYDLHLKGMDTSSIAKHVGAPEKIVIKVLYLNGVPFKKTVRINDKIENDIYAHAKRFAKKRKG